jgi:FG-GAP-like repeat
VNAITPARPGAVSGFVLKLRSDGNQFLFSTYLGGSQGMLGAEQVNALAVSQAGAVYLGGVTSSADFPTLNAYQTTFRGWNTDAFLTGMSADGKLLFSTFLGGSQGDNIAGLAWNEANSTITVSGPTMSPDFPGLAASGSFIARFSSSGQYQQTVAGLDGNVSVAAIATTGSSPNLAIAGTRQNVGGPTGFFAQITPPTLGPPALLWCNPATGLVKEWLLAGAQGNLYNSSVWLNQTSIPGWAVVAWADFNGDGVPDLVWQNQVTHQVSVAYMSVLGSVIGVNWFSQVGQPGWSVVAVADLNRDGVPDLIWQNDTTRQVKVWYMGGSQGNVNIGWNWLNQSGVPGWKIVAAGDLNHDGVPDLIWMNDTTRQASVGYMGGAQGAVTIGVGWISQSGLPGWKVVAVADLNRDGAVDLIWQNDATAQVMVWYLGGLGGNVNTGWNWLDPTGTPGWSVIAAQPLAK